MGRAQTLTLRGAIGEPNDENAEERKLEIQNRSKIAFSFLNDFHLTSMKFEVKVPVSPCEITRLGFFAPGDPQEKTTKHSLLPT